MSDRRRALLTESERKRIAGEANQAQYEAVSRVRRKITEELPTDVALLRKHHPELFEELQATVCEETEESL